MLNESPGGVLNGKNLCHETYGQRIAINIELGGAGGSVDVHLTSVDDKVVRLYSMAVAKFLPSTEGCAYFNFCKHRSSAVA